MTQNSTVAEELKAWDFTKTTIADSVGAQDGSVLFFPLLVRSQHGAAELLDLKGISQLLGTEYHNLLILSAEQELLHSLLANLMCRARWDQVDDLRPAVLDLYQSLTADDAFQRFRAGCVEHKSESDRIVGQYLEGKPVSDTVRTKLAQYRQELEMAGGSDRQFLQTYLATRLYKDYLSGYRTRALEPAVNTAIDGLFRAGRLQKAQMHTCDDASLHHFIVTGPHAAGKTSSKARIEHFAGLVGQRQDDILRIDGEDIRYLFIELYKTLLQRDDITLHTVAPDVKLFKESLMDVIEQNYRQNHVRSMATFYINALDNTRFIELATSGAATLHVIHKDLPPEISIMRAYVRFHETGRGSIPAKINQHNQKLPDVLLAFLHNNAGKRICYEMEDASVPFNVLPPGIMYIDMQSRHCEISNMKKLFEFFHKKHIADIQAKPSPDSRDMDELTHTFRTQLYHDNGAEPLQSSYWIRELAQLFDITVVDPKTHQALLTTGRDGHIDIPDRRELNKALITDKYLKNFAQMLIPDLNKAVGRVSARGKL